MGAVISAFVECIASALDAMYHKRQHELQIGKSKSNEELKKDIKEMKESIIKGDEVLNQVAKEIELLSPRKKREKDKIN